MMGNDEVINKCNQCATQFTSAEKKFAEYFFPNALILKKLQLIKLNNNIFSVHLTMNNMKKFQKKVAQRLTSETSSQGNPNDAVEDITSILKQTDC